MIKNLVCSECGGEMQEGYIPDFTRGTARQSFWVEGAFEKDFWGFPKYKGKKTHRITAYRCENCGFIKLFAKGKKEE